MRLPAATVPDVATPQVIARTTGSLWAAGGVAALATAAGLPGGLPRAVVAGAGAFAVLAGLAVLAGGRHLPRPMFHLLVGAGTVLIGLVTVEAPTGASATALAAVLTFVAVDAFFFFAWPEALAHLVTVIAVVLVTLGGRPDVGPGPAAALAVVCLAVSLVVGALVRLASRASRDTLTGLANRRGFDAGYEEAIAAAVRRDLPLAVALFDVDHFKVVNDTRGHPAGDALLRDLARRCSAVLPDGALLARRGGDEFALVLPGADADAGLAVVERVRAAAPTSLSCGVAQLLPGESGADLLRRADAALYAAKRAGRGRAVLSADATDDVARDLAAAVAEGAVTVVLQPLVALPGEEVVAVEALARWDHPRRGPVPPAVFVPAAEHTGLVGALGELVLRGACAQARLLEERWGTPLLLSVNASGRELVEPGYPDRVLGVLAAAGRPPQRLVVEVTESVVEGAAQAALAALETLRRHGVRVAIDDFGTGYSAFARLDTLPADYLKLDRSFVGTITTSQRRRTMLSALLGLSAGLGLVVVAEGVETAEQAALLASLGCPLAQGYRYGRPAAAQDLARGGGVRGDGLTVPAPRTGR